MEIKIIENDFNQEKFNKVATHPLQSWEWGEARKAMDIEVLRIGEFDNDKLINTFQITFHAVPYSSFKIGYLPRSVFPSKKVLDWLHQYGKERTIIFIKIEPYIKKSDSKQSMFDHRLTRSSHPLFPDWTMILDLHQSEEDLQKNLKPKTRYNIRLAQKKGVVIKEESNDKGFEIFSQLYFDTTKRQKYYGHNEEYHKIVWNHLKNNIAHILIAYYNNVPLAAYELFYFNNILYYPYGGTSDEYRNFMAANLIMWEAIMLGKKLKAETFDMWGSLPEGYDQSHSWAGFTRFKEGYNGQFTEMIGSYDLVISQSQYTLYNVLNKARNIFLQMKR